MCYLALEWRLTGSKAWQTRVRLQDIEMYRTILIVTAAAVVLSLGTAKASTEWEPELPEIELLPTTTPHKLSIAPWFVGGVLTGGARKLIKPDTSGFTDKVLVGGGVSVYDFLSPKWAVGASFSLAWKDIPGTDWGPIRGISYSIGGLYDLYPFDRTSPYVRMDIGLDKVSFCNHFGHTVDFGLHPFIELGTGMRMYPSGSTKLNFSLFLRYMPTNGHVIEGLGDRLVRFDTIYLGADIGLSFPLKKFPLWTIFPASL